MESVRLDHRFSALLHEFVARKTIMWANLRGFAFSLERDSLLRLRRQ
jgi:hypothetical protein